MHEDIALLLFRRLGVDAALMSRAKFTAAYYQLARRYHPDVNPATSELMAAINVARATLVRGHSIGRFWKGM